MVNNFFSKFHFRKRKQQRSLPKLDRLNDLELAIASEQDKSLEQATASMNLQDIGLKFEDGVWKAEIIGKLSSDDVEVLKKENLRLLEENNMLNLKISILLDMLSETTAESHILERERNNAIKAVQKTLFR